MKFAGDAFYFTRYGLTDANLQKLLCGGAWDIPLNAEGHAQVAQSAIDNKKALADIRTVCCSPLLRARQTADYFVRKLSVPLVIVEELKEQSLGVWEKKPWQDVPDFFSGHKDPPEGETLRDFDARIERGLQLALQNEGPVLIVSHGAVWFALHRILGISPEQPGSCSIFHFQKHPGGFQRKRLLPPLADG